MICRLFLLASFADFSNTINIYLRHSWRLKVFKKDASKKAY